MTIKNGKQHNNFCFLIKDYITKTIKHIDAIKDKTM